MENNKKITNFIVFSTSLTILAFEIIFIRIFALKEWQNYASMIICLALLGFGISGTIITLLKNWIKKNIIFVNIISMILYFLFLIISFILYSIIPFNPFEIGWDYRQIFYLFLHFIVLLLPFTAGPFIIGVQFLGNVNISRIYFSNLIGSGAGTIIVLFLLSLFHAYTSLIILLSIISITIVIFLTYDFFKRQKKIIYLAIGIMIILVPFLFYLLLKNSDLLKVSEYKGISYALKMPNAKVLVEKHNPLGFVQVIEAEGLRVVNGLSYNFQGQIPVQKGIYFDGDSVSAITPFDDDFNKVDFLKYTSSALPFYLLENEKNKSSLIVGAGGGEGILRSLSFGIKQVVGIEINKNVIEIMKNNFADYSGNIYNHKNVKIINSDARQYIRGAKSKYDIIEISLLDSFTAAASGVYSLNESYLYTIESFKEFYDRLSDRGILAITRWLKEPPRDNVKLFATIVKVMRKNEIVDFNKKIAFIRSANTATLCVSKQKINTDIVRRFCDKNSFDLIYVSNIKDNEINVNFRLKKPYFYEACKKIITDNAEEFINNYSFFVKPATDDSPYYFNFFKLKTIKSILETGTRQIPFTEWGYAILVILLIPVSLLSFILIIIPLFIVKKNAITSSSVPIRLNVFLYFFMIGIGFFFIEMSLIQKFILFLSHPMYSLTVIISSILIFSGLGSYFSNRIKDKNKSIVFIIIGIIIAIYILFLDRIFMIFITQNIITKIIISVILLGIPGFFMGIPFPSALSIIKNKNESLVPWAWGINGFASVISILLAAILAIIIGFTKVLMIAVLLYLIAGIIYGKIRKS